MMPDLSNLDEIISRSLKSLLKDISQHSWYGREREIVSLYAFGHLLPLCSASSVLFDPTQIGIEVAVPQLKAESNRRLKTLICKNVVIWSRPKMTCWNTESDCFQYPLAVLEWKSVNRIDGATQRKRKLTEYQSDVEWLRRTSELARGFVGYAVLIFQDSGKPTLKCSRAFNDSVEDKWLVLKPEEIKYT